jgi:hypothetical protein
MSFAARCLLAAAALVVTGCASVQSQQAKLDTARSCCSGFTEMSYARLALPELRSIAFNESSPAFAFATGKSYFAALELPDWTGPYEVLLESNSGGARGGMFKPSVMTLDRDFQPLREWNTQARRGTSEFARVEFFVNEANKDERYLIIYSESAGKGGMPALVATPIVTSIGLATIQLGATESRITVPYAPMGNVTLSVKPYIPRRAVPNSGP